MQLELKRGLGALQAGLRAVPRLAARRGIECHGVLEGVDAETLHFNVNATGPLWERSECEVVLHAMRENRLVSCRKLVAPEREVAPEALVDELDRLLAAQGCVHEDLSSFVLETAPQGGDAVDPQLVEAPPEEFIGFFRSRLLVDAPKRLLFRAEITRGVRYQGYFAAGTGLLLYSSSFCLLGASLRTERIHLPFHLFGRTLKEMRLSSIRRRLAPCWRAVEGDVPSAPGRVLLDSEALAHLARAGLDRHAADDQDFLNWLEPAHDRSVFLPLRELPGGDHPLGAALGRHFRCWHQREGKAARPLEAVLESGAGDGGDLLWLPNLAGISVLDGRIRAHGHGTAFHIPDGGPPVIHPGSVRLTLDGETFLKQKDHASVARRLHYDPALRHPFLLLPEYMVLEGLEPEPFQVDPGDLDAPSF